MKPNRFLTSAAGIILVLSAFAAADAANAGGKEKENGQEAGNGPALDVGNHEVRLSNLSHKPLTNIEIQLSGKDAGDFSQTNNCRGKLEERESCVIKVAFSPKTTGEKIATLEVHTSLGIKGVTLTGTGK